MMLEKITLENGLRILLEPDKTTRTAFYGIWALSGSVYENPAQNGISHFAEHILFKGTGRRSAAAIAEEMDGIGGELNAYTTKDFTCYHARTLTEYIPVGFDILCDMLTEPRLDKADIETERAVILEEVSMCEDDPEDLVYEQLTQRIWNGTPFARPILGTRDTLLAMDQESLRDCLKSRYAPDRLVISICGNYDRDTFVEMAKSYFSCGAEAARTLEYPQISYTKQYVHTFKDYEQVHFVMAAPGYASTDSRRFAAALFNTVAGGSSSSRLFRRIREELGLAYGIDSSFASYLTGGIFRIFSAVNPERLKEALDETVLVLKELKKTGITEKELMRAKAQTKAQLVMSNEWVGARASRNAVNELFERETVTLDQMSEIVDKITLDEVNTVAAELLDFDAFSLSVVGVIKNPDEMECYFNKLLSEECSN